MREQPVRADDANAENNASQTPPVLQGFSLLDDEASAHELKYLASTNPNQVQACRFLLPTNTCANCHFPSVLKGCTGRRPPIVLEPR